VLHCCLEERSASIPTPDVRIAPVSNRRAEVNSTETEMATGVHERGDANHYRTTRKVLAALSSLGVVETVYIFGAKVFASPQAICATRGCVDVLSGPYSSFLGIPLSAIGVAAYALFAWLSAWPLTASDEEVVINDDGDAVIRLADEVYLIRDAITRPLLLALASILVVFASYFMFLLTVVIRDTCPYCIFSATLSISLFVVTAFVSRAVRDVKQAVTISSASAITAACTAAAVFILSSPGGLLAQMPSEPQLPPPITAQSDARSMQISRRLQKRNTKMYGSWWCTHCHDQKERLGKKAFSRVTYVECDRGGVDSQAKLCREKRIPGYPTWEIDGELYPGELAIDDLEKLANGLPLSSDEDAVSGRVSKK
jgi:uncharacterized membrane protein/glutaredoxin